MLIALRTVFAADAVSPAGKDGQGTRFAAGIHPKLALLVGVRGATLAQAAPRYRPRRTAPS